MKELFQPARIEELLGLAQSWFVGNVLIVGNLVQLGLVAFAFLIARLLSKPLAKRLRGFQPNAAAAQRGTQILAHLLLPIIWLALQWTMILVSSYTEQPLQLLEIVASLLTAWLVIRLFSSLVGENVWTRLVAWVAWTIAALNILELLQPTIAILDSVAIETGEVRVSPYFVIKTMMALALLLWVATYIAAVMESRISSSTSLSPSLKVLINKLLKFTLLALAFVIAIRMVGVDLTALAVFGGAVGLGLGFGMQKVIANLVSGLILLMDKSIKPGDVIAVNETYGWVNTLGGRYVSVITRDGKEHLIPNEILVTERVENWSHSDNLVRIKVAVGVHYQSDVHKAIELCLAAAGETERILKKPEPVCLLTGFGDSSVDLELRMWINDPYNGVTNVCSKVFLNIWDKFHASGIEIPYPQRDLHLRSPASVIEALSRAPQA